MKKKETNASKTRAFGEEPLSEKKRKQTGGKRWLITPAVILFVLYLLVGIGIHFRTLKTLWTKEEEAARTAVLVSYLERLGEAQKDGGDNRRTVEKLEEIIRTMVFEKGTAAKKDRETAAFGKELIERLSVANGQSFTGFTVDKPIRAEYSYYGKGEVGFVLYYKRNLSKDEGDVFFDGCIVKKTEEEIPDGDPFKEDLKGLRGVMVKKNGSWKIKYFY